MSRERTANGSSVAAVYPYNIVTPPSIRYADSTGYAVRDELISVNSTGLMELDFAPIRPSAVEIYTDINKGGDKLTTIVSGTPADGEVLVEGDGALTFHADEYTSSCYAWYVAAGTRITKTIIETIFAEIEAIQRVGGVALIGKCNEDIATGDIVYPVGYASPYWVFAKTSDPIAAWGVCMAAGNQNAVTGFVHAGLVAGLDETFGAGNALYVGSNGKLTTVGIGSIPAIRRPVGRSIADGQCWINFGSLAFD